MARKKRLEKKLKAREKEWVSRAEDLFLRGQNEAFLASLRRRGDDVPAALATAYAEVRQGVVRSALEAADLARIEQELRHGPIDGAAGALAQAVACHLAGDDDGARDAVRRAEGTEQLDGLRRGLAMLLGEARPADEVGLPAPARTVIESFRRLSPIAEAARSGRGSGRGSLDDPRLDAVRQMIDALVTMRHRSFSPGAGSAAKLRAACGRLEKLVPGSTIVAAAAPRARVLAAVIEAEKKVRAGRGGAAERAIRALGPIVDEIGVLAERPSAGVEGVHFALRRRSRKLLAAVAATEGAEGLATLVAEAPALAGELTLDGTVLDAEDRLLEAVRLREPWNRMTPTEVADRVARLGKEETDPLRYAQLIQIELDGRLGAIDTAVAHGQDPERVGRVAIERLQQVAHGLNRQPPSLAVEMAKVLRADLAVVTCSVVAGTQWFRLSETLLVHLPGDPVLLTIAIAGARAAGDRHGVERLHRAIEVAAKEPPRNVEIELFEQLIQGVASERIGTLEVCLAALRQLLPQAAWQELRPMAAQAFALSILEEVLVVERGMGLSRDEAGETVAEFVAAEAAVLEAHLGGEPEFEALRVVLACTHGQIAENVLRVEGFLARYGGFEAAAALHRGLRRVADDLEPGTSRISRELLSRTAGRALQSIEPGRPVVEWLPGALSLSSDLDGRGLIRLCELLRRQRDLAEDPMLAQALDELVSGFDHGEAWVSPSKDERPGRRAAKPKDSRPRPTPKRTSPQLKLF